MRWERILARVLKTDAPQKKILTLQAQASAIGRAIADVTMAIQHGLDGRLLTLEETLAAPQTHSLAAQYGMVRIFNLLTPLLKLIGELGHTGFYGSPKSDDPHVLVYSEFFVLFGGTAAEIRKKKRWP